MPSIVTILASIEEVNTPLELRLHLCSYTGASAGIFALSTAHITSINLNCMEDIAILRRRWSNKEWKIFGRKIKTSDFLTALIVSVR